MFAIFLNIYQYSVVGFACVSLELFPLGIARLILVQQHYSRTTVELYELLDPETKLRRVRCRSYLRHYVI